MKEKIQLSDHFTYRKLLRFAMPSIIMMVFTSIYGVVDGFFVSNFAGKTAFAAVNFIMPYIMVLGGMGFMVGTGGCALIGKTLGEGKKEKANRLFSMLVYFSILFGICLSIIGKLTARPIAAFLGAEGQMLDICAEYGNIVLFGVPAFMLQSEFQGFFVVAEKPKLGLYTTLIAGCTNMVLDALFVGVFGLGVKGAAVATLISMLAGGFLPIIYFARENTSLLRLGRTEFMGRELVKSMGNGASEFVSNISMSIVSMVFNVQLMKYIGEDGVSAYGVLMYVCFVFMAIYFGFVTGTAPIVSFHYGADNREELSNLLRKSLKILLTTAVFMFLIGEFLARPIALVFVGYDADLTNLTEHVFRIYSFTFLIAPIPIYGSSFFTALNNGLISATISFLRTVVFELISVLVLPLIFGVEGIWYSMLIAEIAAAIISIIFWTSNRKRYGY